MTRHAPLTTSTCVLAIVAAATASCNQITGANDLTFSLTSGAGGGAGATTAGAGGAGSTTTTTTTTTMTTGPSATGPSATSSSSSGNPGSAMVPAQGVTITQVAIYQGPKLVLSGGTETGSVKVPVVAGREALVRVFVQTDGTYDGSPVTAHLFLGQGSTPIEVVGAVTTSSEGTLSSTINFDVPGASIVAGVGYRVELLQPPSHSKGTNAAASSPASGFAPLGATSDGPQLKVVVIPVQYGGDGSNRLPDTSATMLQGYKDAFMATYPIQSIDLTVGTPFPWSSAIGADGTGWSELLQALADKRQQAGTAPDVYWYGAFQPGASFAQFCGSGCVAGLGLIGQATDDYSRAAIGLGFDDPSAFTTIIHETGHTQGRQHAPCGGAQNVDPAFPYANGDIGDWGYDLVHKTLYAPGKASDMMGYCDPVWISDYTFNAIFQRIKLVNGAEIVYPPDQMDRLWERAKVDAQGGLAWLPPIQLHTPPMGEAKPVTVQGAAGSAIVEGHYFTYDHLPGGILMWPASPAPTTGIQVTVAGKPQTLLH